METDFFPLSAQENVSRGVADCQIRRVGGDVRRWSQGVKSYLRLIFFRPMCLFGLSLVSVIATKSNELFFVVGLKELLHGGFASRKG